MSLTDDIAFLCQASMPSLEDFEQSRLNHVDLLTKRRRALDEEIRKEQAAADVARLLIENWRLRELLGAQPLQVSLPFKEERRGKADAA